MNILFLTNHFNAGGITTYVFSLAKGLVGRGHRVYIGSAGGERVDELQAAGIGHILLRFNTKSELSLKIYLSLNPLVKLVRDQHIDVIHAQTRVAQVAGQLLSQITGKPLVTTCHGFFKKRMGRRLYPCWGKTVIAISPQVKQHLLEDFSVPEDNIALIPNGVDPDEYKPLDEEFKKIKKHKYSLKSGSVVGILARLSDVKGHKYLIQAMKEVVKSYPDTSLFIVGKGREENTLRQLSVELGLEDHVKFCNQTSRTAEFLTIFDIFVMPSLQEGLGLAVLEAQAAGLPVIASNVGGLPLLIENGRTGLLVEPGDVKQLAGAILKLLDDRAMAGELAIQGRESVRQNFSLQQMVDKTLAVYQKVLGHG